MEQLLTIEQIADFLQVKQSTIYAWVHQEFIPHIKVGRLVRFQQSKITEWLEKRETAGRLSRKIRVEL